MHAHGFVEKGHAMACHANAAGEVIRMGGCVSGCPERCNLWDNSEDSLDKRSPSHFAMWDGMGWQEVASQGLVSCSKPRNRR